MEVEWLSNNLSELYKYLNEVRDDSLFGNEFIKVLLERQDYTWQLVFRVFLPFAVYQTVCLIFFSAYVTESESEIEFFGAPD
jgi:two-component SAPR family response regulator